MCTRKAILVFSFLFSRFPVTLQITTFDQFFFPSLPVKTQLSALRVSLKRVAFSLVLLLAGLKRELNFKKKSRQAEESKRQLQYENRGRREKSKRGEKNWVNKKLRNDNLEKKRSRKKKMYVRVLIDHKKKARVFSFLMFFFLLFGGTSDGLWRRNLIEMSRIKEMSFFLFGWRLIELRCFLLVSKRQGLEWNLFGFFSAHLCLCKCVCVCYRAKKAKRSWRGGDGKNARQRVRLQ